MTYYRNKLFHKSLYSVTSQLTGETSSKLMPLPCFWSCRQLNYLKDCYSNIYNTACGKTAALTMGGLIAAAFEDPFYLRFKYKPNCEDHVVPTKSPTHVRSQGSRRASSSRSSPFSSRTRKKDSSYNTIEHRVSSAPRMRDGYRGYHLLLSLLSFASLVYSRSAIYVLTWLFRWTCHTFFTFERDFP